MFSQTPMHLCEAKLTQSICRMCVYTGLPPSLQKQMKSYLQQQKFLLINHKKDSRTSFR